LETEKEAFRRGVPVGIFAAPPAGVEVLFETLGVPGEAAFAEGPARGTTGEAFGEGPKSNNIDSSSAILSAFDGAMSGLLACRGGVATTEGRGGATVLLAAGPVGGATAALGALAAGAGALTGSAEAAGLVVGGANSARILSKSSKVDMLIN